MPDIPSMEDHALQPDAPMQEGSDRAKLIALIIVTLLAVVGIVLYHQGNVGVTLFQAGDYAAALETLELTPFARPTYVAAACKLAEQQLDAGDYAAAHQTLQRAERQSGASAIRRASEDCAHRGDHSTALACVSLLKAPDRAPQLDQLAQIAQKQGDPAQAEGYRNQPGMLYAYCQALDGLDHEISLRAKASRLRKAIPPFQESGSYRDAPAFAAFLTALCDGLEHNAPDQLEQAINVLLDAVDGSHPHLIRMGTALLENLGVDLTLAQALPLQHQLRLATGHKDDSYRLSDVKEAMNNAHTAIDVQPKAGECLIDYESDPWALCRGKSAGKVVIQAQHPTYIPGSVTSSSDTAVHFVRFDLMRCLPADRFPASLEEVDYVITLLYGYEEITAYEEDEPSQLNLTIPGLQEFGMVIISDVNTNQTIYASNLIWAKEPPETYLKSDNRALFYITGGRPSLTQKLITALDIVLQLP